MLKINRSQNYPTVATPGYAWHYVYRLEVEGTFVPPEMIRDVPGCGQMTITFEGTPLATLRKIAKTIGKKYDMKVVETFL